MYSLGGSLTMNHLFTAHPLCHLMSSLFSSTTPSTPSYMDNMIYEQPLNQNNIQDNGQLTSPHQHAYTPLQLPQYGKAAQSNDRLAFLRSNKRLLSQEIILMHIFVLCRGQEHDNMAMVRRMWKMGK